MKQSIFLVFFLAACLNSLARAQPQNKPVSPAVVRLLPTTNSVDLHVRAERIKGAHTLLQFILSRYPEPEPPDQTLMSFYQRKQEYWQSIVGDNTREAVKVMQELSADPRASAILHFHSRRRLASSSACIDSIKSARDSKSEISCYFGVWQALSYAERNAEERSKISKSPDDRERASDEAYWLREAAGLMMSLIAGSGGFATEYVSTVWSSKCSPGDVFKVYLDRCDRDRHLPR